MVVGGFERDGGIGLDLKNNEAVVGFNLKINEVVVQTRWWWLTVTENIDSAGEGWW